MVAGITVYVEDAVEERSLSRAAEEAIRQWVAGHEALLEEARVPEDPVGAVRGMLRGVGKSGVELQHEARRVRAVGAPGRG